MNITDKLALTARENPTKTAYIFTDKETTYGELEGMVQKFADGLQKLGFRQGDHIALVLGNSPYYVIGLHGALRLGLTVIPMNPLYTPTEMAFMLKDGDVKGIITMDILIDKFIPIVDDLPALEYIINCESGNEVPESIKKDHLPTNILRFQEVITNGQFPFNGPKLVGEDLAVILYTSGTTGKPKGAMLTHKNLYSNAQDVANYLHINQDDRVIAALPMFHVFCLTVSLNAPLLNGGTIIILPQFSPTEVFRVARAYQATVFAGVPTMYNYLLQSVKGNVDSFSSLRLCISGGAAMPVSLLESFEQAFNVKVSEGYGLSEAAPVTCFNPLDRPRKAGSIGQNIVNVINKVVDEIGNELPPGEVGELVVQGPNVMKGYYKMEEETAAAIRDGWLYTGDMARMDEDGYFYIVDRKKDMILVGGYNVYPREVEEVFYSHPSVVEVAVIGVPDPQTGEAVIAYVVVDNSDVKEIDLIEFSKQHLAKYKVPQSISFLEELPKNTTGKILRKSLKDQVTNS
ncbi:long-chain fatty-acid-CoA ligase [Oceanobacillus iheyensis HTE831]|uniref:Long-chain fatty-acid-CoA ligase n=1 Tax=Oceanobacillus iheyensis (strain DSM 14371 / CIP 107618 / JCM 11309 / KCTC 3954 / HTE831) TaxID=221109 RepID=Q8ERX1_OCEIH|nr:fatty acid--CoA ligase family protein [Oceanobacillus iheyensis]BAC13132.1 long-chain fatty-acid-CoA ligase [Oceanobacillus iheyensis HTE831]